MFLVVKRKTLVIIISIVLVVVLFGGVLAIALTSFATKFILNKDVDKAKKIVVGDIVKMAGEIPENRMYLAHAVVSAARLAVENIGKKSKED